MAVLGERLAAHAAPEREEDLAASPMSCCGSVCSSADGTTVVADEPWLAFDSDEDSESECAEADAEVQQHLEDMNTASREVNDLQRELAAQMERRRALEELWACGGARLARAAGREGLAAARAREAQAQYCHAAQEAVAAASARFSSAGAEAAEAARRCHASCVAQCRAARERLTEAQRRLDALGAEVAGRVHEYLEAEALYREELAEINGCVAAAELHLGETKARYRGALDGLEALSEQMHARRSRTV